MSAAPSAPAAIRWDLSALFSGIDDPKIEAFWKSAKGEAEAFVARYKGKIDSPDLDAATLAGALREIEALSQEVSKPLTFAHLMFAGDTGSSEIGAFLQRQRERATELSVLLLFFDLELQAAPEEAIERALKDPALEGYVHYVRVARTFSPYRLSEKEEVVLEEVANTGSRAWVRLFEEVTANNTFALRRPGATEPEMLSQQQILTLFRDPDRAVRQAAADGFTEGLLAQQRVLGFTFNTLLQDKSVEDRLRGHQFAEQARHLSNELSRETVDLVVRLCWQHVGLVERFYTVKREILGLPELTHIDRYAPIFPAEEEVSYDRAREIILAAFGGFSVEMARRAGEFFDRSWVDAEPRKGKQGGAFCSYCTPDTHPVVLMTYLGKMDDVMTLAHELGHGAHASLSRAQSYFNFHGTLPLAELASTFGEMLVFESLVAQATPKDRLALYAEKIEGIFATVFRQAAMFDFERDCHRSRREQGELSAEAIGELWQSRLQAMFGSSVKLGEQHRHWWSYVGHFVHAPFYVYAYAFGELLVLSLFQMAKAEGPSFAERYVRVLERGGARSPAELMSELGVDIESEAFWQGGFAAMERLVSEFEQQWGALRGVT